MSSALVLGKEYALPPGSGLGKSANDTASQKRKRTVLILDDEPLIADTLAEILNDSGDFEAVAVYDGASALQHVRSGAPDILITDVVMPEMNGIEVAKAVRSIRPKTRVVLLSGQAQTRDLVEEARHEGHSFELWAKPIHPDDLLERLKQKQV
jgi:CheY-like chemotaxis protein